MPRLQSGITNVGNTLVAPHKDVEFSTPCGAVKVAAGAAALVVIQPGVAVSVYDLHDNHTGDVKLKVGDNEIVLAPGRHVTIAQNPVDDFVAVNPFGAIAHRDLQTNRSEAYTVFSSEFSIPSAVQGVNVLSTLKLTGDRLDGKLADQMMRDAAILMQIGTGKGGAYQRLGSKVQASKLAIAE
jgi:hypothetical protein